jgi:hypothetical protein
MARYTIKSSTVFVALGEETRVFRSVEDVPAEWRRRFEKPRGGIKPQTILIADRRGRDEIMKALQGAPTTLRPRWNRNLPVEPPEAPSSLGTRWTRQDILVELALAGWLGLALLAAFWRW